jgi:hypothetical protein
MDLGHDFAIAATFAPGRYANRIDSLTVAQHAQHLFREEMRSSFVLTLTEGGSAHLCRGWRYTSSNAGPASRVEERIREQIGYRGGWRRQDECVEVDLTLDDTACRRVAQYSHLVPTHAPEWQLRFLPLQHLANPPLAERILACIPPETQLALGELAPHVVMGVLPGKWLVLSGGNGLCIDIKRGSSGDPIICLTASAGEILPDAWERP